MSAAKTFAAQHKTKKQNHPPFGPAKRRAVLLLRWIPEQGAHVRGRGPQGYRYSGIRAKRVEANCQYEWKSADLSAALHPATELAGDPDRYEMTNQN